MRFHCHLLDFFCLNHAIRRVIANDLSPGAVEAMRRNVAINGLTSPATSPQNVSSETTSDVSLPLVEVNEGDAW